MPNVPAGVRSPEPRVRKRELTLTSYTPVFTHVPPQTNKQINKIHKQMNKRTNEEMMVKNKNEGLERL